MSLPDAYDMWSAHQSKLEKELERYPKCKYCDNPIEDDSLLNIYNDLFHINCAIEKFEENTEEYIE